MKATVQGVKAAVHKMMQMLILDIHMTVIQFLSNIIFDIPNMDPDKDKEAHDYVYYEQHRAFFASLINNLTCDIEKCNKVNQEAQQANALLTNKLERYKEKEKQFAKDKTIEYEYCKKIKILNDEISNLKSQACQNDKTFAKENGKYDEIGGEKIIFGNETSSFETKIKELEMTLAQQTKDFEDAKVDFSKKTDKFEIYFEKIEKTRVVLERQLDHKIQDSKAEKDQFLKQIASLE
ncbi:hypothetical protein Tco_0744125 [Tanacetum coccineum]